MTAFFLCTLDLMQFLFFSFCSYTIRYGGLCLPACRFSYAIRYRLFILYDRAWVSLEPPPVGSPRPPPARVCCPGSPRTCRVPRISIRSHRCCFWRGCSWSPCGRERLSKGCFIACEKKEWLVIYLDFGVVDSAPD